MSVANTSQHLQALRSAQLVTVRREGPYAFYRLAEVGVFKVWQAVRDLGETRLAEIERLIESFIGDRNEPEPVSARELAERSSTGDAVVLDVRPEVEFRAGHIRGARSIPLHELETRLEELPRDQEIIAYCRGPFCMFADDAVALLRRHGFSARRFELGFPDWRAAGLPAVRR